MNSQEKRWYLARNDQKSGPFSDADVANFVKHGQLKEADLSGAKVLKLRRALTVFPDTTQGASTAGTCSRACTTTGSEPAGRQSSKAGASEVPSTNCRWPHLEESTDCTRLRSRDRGYRGLRLQILRDTLAAGARYRRCKDVARRLYDRVLQIYVGFVFSSLRERAAVGIRDLGT